LESHLQKKGIIHHAVREDDFPYSGQLMAIGVQPAIRSELKKYFRKFKLLDYRRSSNEDTLVEMMVRRHSGDHTKVG
jgi:hypothetical protein